MGVLLPASVRSGVACEVPVTATEGKPVSSQYLYKSQSVMIRTAFALSLAASLHLGVFRVLLNRLPCELIMASLAARSLGLLNIQRHLQESHFESTGAMQLSSGAGVSDVVVSVRSGAERDGCGRSLGGRCSGNRQKAANHETRL